MHTHTCDDFGHCLECEHSANSAVWLMFYTARVWNCPFSYSIPWCENPGIVEAGTNIEKSESCIFVMPNPAHKYWGYFIKKIRGDAVEWKKV